MYIVGITYNYSILRWTHMVVHEPNYANLQVDLESKPFMGAPSEAEALRNAGVDISAVIHLKVGKSGVTKRGIWFASLRLAVTLTHLDTKR